MHTWWRQACCQCGERESLVWLLRPGMWTWATVPATVVHCAVCALRGVHVCTHGGIRPAAHVVSAAWRTGSSCT
jgi:hypothetical protein